MTGEVAPLLVAEERVQKNESVITLPHNTEETAVILMDLLMKNPRVVTAELVLVYILALIFDLNIRCLL